MKPQKTKDESREIFEGTYFKNRMKKEPEKDKVDKVDLSTNQLGEDKSIGRIALNNSSSESSKIEEQSEKEEIWWDSFKFKDKKRVKDIVKEFQPFNKYMNDYVKSLIVRAIDLAIQKTAQLVREEFVKKEFDKMDNIERGITSSVIGQTIEADAKKSEKERILKIIDDRIKYLEKIIEEEMQIQFDAGNLNIDEEELKGKENTKFYSQFIIKGNIVDTKKLEILSWLFEIYGLEELKKRIDER